MTEAVAEQEVAPDTQAAIGDTEAAPSGESLEQSSPSVPAVEHRDGKTYIDGVRMYSRDESNRIASKATQDAEKRILDQLNVDNLDQVKDVVSQLQTAEGESLSVNQLRDAVKKREATVEELRAELDGMKLEQQLSGHIGKLQNSMPEHWNSNQKSAVVDLMKARNMLEVDGDSFGIKFGNEYITDQSGEQPDYQTAVSKVAESLGLSMGKPGQKTFDADSAGAEQRNTRSVGIDQTKLDADPAYRSAYVAVRQMNPTLGRGEITDAMIRKQMPK